ncbi:MAG: hypothetical protein DRM99_02395 [Thermoplasmata archaeon]|nr:MAG: hypothetical protein DRM99_02395 [Thermoplasmata archaeon]
MENKRLKKLARDVLKKFFEKNNLTFEEYNKLLLSLTVFLQYIDLCEKFGIDTATIRKTLWLYLEMDRQYELEKLR